MLFIILVYDIMYKNREVIFMRCKNCGSENEDNLYICQNCGSPLYEEEDVNDTNDDLGQTRVAPVVNTPQKNQPPRKNPNQQDDKKKNEKSTILIIVLAVILAIVIAVLVTVLVHNSKANDNVEETSFATSQLSTTAQTTTELTTTTTTTTTELTTEETTTEPVELFVISAHCSQGGEVEGDGYFPKGEKCTVIARADDGFEFDGWYKNGNRVSSNEAYTFTVNGDTDLEAIFTEMNYEE